jgi:hypothetical protein
MAAIIGLKRTSDLVSWMSSQFLVWRNNDRYPERTVVPIGVNDITWTLGPIYENSCICMCLACSTPITISNSIALARQFSNIVRHFTETRTCSASKVFNQPKKFKSTDSQMLTPVIMNSKCDQHSSVISQALPRVTMLNSPLVSQIMTLCVGGCMCAFVCIICAYYCQSYCYNRPHANRITVISSNFRILSHH